MIAPEIFMVHTPTGKVRRVTGIRGDVVHFSQTIEVAGGKFYWASVGDCVPLGKRESKP